MNKKGKELEFISRIKKDGSGTIPCVTDDMMYLFDNDIFVLNRLSISSNTYVASGFNSYVVRLKEQKDGTELQMWQRLVIGDVTQSQYDNWLKEQQMKKK